MRFFFGSRGGGKPTTDVPISRTISQITLPSQTLYHAPVLNDQLVRLTLERSKFSHKLKYAEKII